MSTSAQSELAAQRAQRLEDENAELRKQLEVMALQKRIDDLERTNEILRNSPTPAKKSASISDIPANSKIPAAISGLDPDSDMVGAASAASSSFRGNGYIECPYYRVNLSQDIKFDEDPFAVGMSLNLKGLMSKTEYRAAIQSVNQLLKKCRTPKGTTATLLIAPMLPFLFVPWVIQNKKIKKKRLKKMLSAAEWFNAEHPGLFMKWETRPRQRLIIMRRDDARRL